MYTCVSFCGSKDPKGVPTCYEYVYGYMYICNMHID